MSARAGQCDRWVSDVAQTGRGDSAQKLNLLAVAEHGCAAVVVACGWATCHARKVPSQYVVQ